MTLTTTDYSTLCDEAADFLRRIDPLDLPTSHPLYIVDGANLGLTEDDSILGLQSRTLDLALIETIGDAWQGRGTALAVNFNALRLRNKDDNAFRTAVVCTILHETAHALVSGLYHTMPPVTANRLLAFNKRVKSAIAADPVEPVDRDTHFDSHSLPFIRAALHLHTRAFKTNAYPLMGLGLYDVLDTASYGLSDTRRYVNALGDEPDRLSGEPISAILKTPAPAAFSTLFTSDDQNRRAAHHRHFKAVYA